MYTRRARVLLQNCLVLLLGLIPLSLHLESFRIQFVCLGRIGSASRQFLRGSSGEIRVGVDREIEHLRIVREVACKPTKKLGRRRIRIDIDHGAAHTGETSLPLEVFLSAASSSLSQKW